MKYILIDPVAQVIKLRDFPTDSLSTGFHAAITEVGLTNGQLDFGVISRDTSGNGLQIAVYENGLIDPKIPYYFSINKELYNGPAVLFAFNFEGETIDIKASQVPQILWLEDKPAVEYAIQMGLVNRPTTTINGAPIWTFGNTK